MLGTTPLKHLKWIFLITLVHFVATLALMFYSSYIIHSNAMAETSLSVFQQAILSAFHILAIPLKFIAREVIESRSMQIFPLLALNSLIWGIVVSSLMRIKERYART